MWAPLSAKEGRERWPGRDGRGGPWSLPMREGRGPLAGLHSRGALEAKGTQAPPPAGVVPGCSTMQLKKREGGQREKEGLTSHSKDRSEAGPWEWGQFWTGSRWPIAAIKSERHREPSEEVQAGAGVSAHRKGSRMSWFPETWQQVQPRAVAVEVESRRPPRPWWT